MSDVLRERYASQEMRDLFSPNFKYTTWKKLWVGLAEAQQELGHPITDAQIAQLRSHQDTVDFELAHKYEKETHHDVVAHIRAYADQCPLARGIIHLGATSCYVTDNGDLIAMKAALHLIKQKLLLTISKLAAFAKIHANITCVGYTHFQPAQPTTVGKRACLWLQDLVFDYHHLDAISLPFLGAKGATGTQSSFLTLFDNDPGAPQKLDQILAKKFGFTDLLPIASQTYPRKIDHHILSTLSYLATSLHKCATDIRLLAHLNEVSESFGTSQVGSSAMPHKRNPILSERLCSLSRYLLSLPQNTAYTASLQWLERSLDDSANRRITIPDAFLTADSMLNIAIHLFSNLQVDTHVIQTNLEKEHPHLILESILMKAVKKGQSRQAIHEHLRQYAHTTDKKHLIEKLKTDTVLKLTPEEITQIAEESTHAGLAPQQTLAYIKDHIEPLPIPSIPKSPKPPI
ncbi:MAG: adenylosuccinate lyase [Chlamydiales bacterium]|nr:adenylosuccinate lyase [Chlamydiales bacterium]